MVGAMTGPKAAMMAGAVIFGLFAAQTSAHAAQTTHNLHLRQAPSLQAPILLTMPAGSRVSVRKCNAGWCRVAYKGRKGYASQTGLSQASGREALMVVPIDPSYPYRAGYYPTADSYYSYPPYAEERPNFYRRRFLLSPREWNRYRYRPHIFTRRDVAAEYGQ